MESVQTRVEALRVELKEKYGTDNINVQTGIITYPTEQPPVNIEENGQVNS